LLIEHGRLWERYSDIDAILSAALESLERSDVDDAMSKLQGVLGRVPRAVPL
jgi:hypothetical protein